MSPCVVVLIKGEEEVRKPICDSWLMSGGGETVGLHQCNRSAKEDFNMNDAELGITPRQGFTEAAKRHRQEKATGHNRKETAREG